jgi:Holliday junction resolvasome RuvABC endonuclease subunit
VIAVGVDPSLSGTGLARITPAGIVTTRLVRTEPARSLRGTADRIRYITGHVVRFTPAGSLALIEEMYIPKGKKAAGGVLERAWLWGFIADQLLRRGCTVVKVPAPRRAKLATGNGNSDKDEVLATMRERFPATSIVDDNVADALALAAAAARWAGFPADGPLNEGQTQAMTTVAWPTPEKRRA